MLSLGFIADTQIMTPNGYEYIQNLKIGDIVISCNFDTSQYPYCKTQVIKTSIRKLKKCIKITINNQEIFCSHNQKFYCPINYSWIKAKNLTLNTTLLAYNNKCNIIYPEKIERINQDNVFYDISVSKYNNFCITENNILVHNASDTFYAAAQIAMEFVSASATILENKEIRDAILQGSILVALKLSMAIKNKNNKIDNTNKDQYGNSIDQYGNAIVKELDLNDPGLSDLNQPESQYEI